MSYDQLQGVEVVNVSLPSSVLLTLSADQVFLTYADEDRRSMTYTGQCILTYAPAAAFLIEARAGIRRLQDTLFPRERTIDASLKLRWFLRGLEVYPTLAWLHRLRGATTARDLQVLLRLTRRF